MRRSGDSRRKGAQAPWPSPRKRGEFESEARLRAILDSAVDGIITIDERGLIVEVNTAAQRLFGYTAEEMVGQNVKILMPQPYQREHDTYLENYRRTGRRKIIGIGREVAGRRKDGTIFPLDLSVSEVPLGERRLFTGIVRDISERRRIEAERQKFVSLIENSSDFIAVASLHWQITYLNKAAQDMIGVRPEEVAGLEIRDLWHEATLPTALENALPAQVRGESFRFEGRVKHFRTGEPIDVDCNTFGIRDPLTGETMAIAFSLRDIREQKRTEQALRDSETRMKAILDSAVDGIVTIDERGTIESVNPAGEKIFGYSAAELTGRNVSMLMPEPYRGEHDQYLRNYRHTGHRKIIGIGREVVGLRKDGSAFSLDLSVSEVMLGDRRLFTGLIRDITERKEGERNRNLLVAELSHRVKNTLATVISVAQQTFRHTKSFESSREIFEGRIQALAQTHTRLAESNWAGASLATVVNDELAPYRRHGSASLRVSGPQVVLNPKRALALGMAFHELATNAAKHGALTAAGGGVDVTWEVTGTRQLFIRWVESGGPPVVPPQRSGFGRLLLERGLAFELRGKVQLDFAPEGLRCTITAPLDGPTEVPAP